MVYQEYENNQIEDQLTFLTGMAAKLLPEAVKSACATWVSQELAEYPHTMLQFTLAQILESIDRGLAVVALGPTQQPVGFAQFWQYGFNEHGQQILEFGSWVSFKKGSGIGTRILQEAIDLGKKIDPTEQLIAIVEEENLQAQAILKKVGAEEIGSKFSPVIKTVEGEAAVMKVFDITNCI